MNDSFLKKGHMGINLISDYYRCLHTSGVIPARRSCSRSCSATSTLAAGEADSSSRGGNFAERYHERGLGGEYGTAHGTPKPLARLPPGNPRIMLRHRCQSTSSHTPSAITLRAIEPHEVEDKIHNNQVTSHNLPTRRVPSAVSEADKSHSR